MEQNNRHPLDAITNSSSLSMLEALIPFVDYPLKLPLALLIKFNEIRLIINAFRSLDYLTQIGLHNPSREPMDILGSLTGMSPEMLKMLFSFAENMNSSLSPDMLSGLTGGGANDFSSLFQNLSSNMVQNTNNTPNDPDPAGKPPFSPKPEATFYDSSGEDFDRNIQSILAEYDLMQAAEFNQSQPETLQTESYINDKEDISS
ncbi:MAG: hypothetical protein ACI4A3_03415 [Lachnospiraceae bacterium]